MDAGDCCCHHPFNTFCGHCVGGLASDWYLLEIQGVVSDAPNDIDCGCDWFNTHSFPASSPDPCVWSAGMIVCDDIGAVWSWGLELENNQVVVTIARAGHTAVFSKGLIAPYFCRRFEDFTFLSEGANILCDWSGASLIVSAIPAP